MELPATKAETKGFYGCRMALGPIAAVLVLALLSSGCAFRLYSDGSYGIAIDGEQAAKFVNELRKGREQRPRGTVMKVEAEK